MPQRRMPSGQGPGSRPRGGRVPARGGAGGREQARGAAVRMTTAQRAGAARSGGPAARPTSRPAPARRSAGTGTVRLTAAPPRHRSGRAAVLGLVLLVLLLTYAYPIRTYLSQQAQIAQLEAGQAAQRRRILALEEQRAKWDDPAYVAAQARRRLQMVRPGEVAYVIVDDPAGAARDAAAQAPDAGRAQATGPWFRQMWSSVRAADRPRVR